jgi:hypothetical protein
VSRFSSVHPLKFCVITIIRPCPHLCISSSWFVVNYLIVQRYTDCYLAVWLKKPLINTREPQRWSVGEWSFRVVGRYSPASHREGPYSRRGQTMWDLSWTKWHWDRFLVRVRRFSLSVSFHRVCIRSCIIWRTNNRPVSGRSSQTFAHHPRVKKDR